MFAVTSEVKGYNLHVPVPPDPLVASQPLALERDQRELNSK